MSNKQVLNKVTKAEDQNWLLRALVISDEKGQRESSKEKNKSEMDSKMHLSIPDIAETKVDTELDREAYMARILAEYRESLSKLSETHLGYPGVIYSDYYDCLVPFLRFHINNIGDPFVSGRFASHSRQFEVAVLDWFAKLWELEDDEYWGYVTNGGTEGNLHGILLGREIFPSGILYTSRESHYSIFKISRMLKLELEVVNTLETGEIDLEDLNARLLLHKDKPAIINVNIGTTFKGAVDDLDLVLETLSQCGFTQDQFYIHCDGALSGILVPFLTSVNKISFKKPIGSISVSGHKFLGCPMPCGIQITRKKHISVLSRSIELIDTIDATISGSRNGHSSIFLWYILYKKGHAGIKKDIQKCVANAHYLTNRLRKNGIPAILNEFSITVVFERPGDDDLIRKWQLACVGNMAHAIILPNISTEVIDNLCDDLLQKRLTI